MATINFGTSTRDGIRKVILLAANDVSDRISLNGPCNILCHGDTTFTVEVYRSMEPDGSDEVLVDVQTNADRTGYYDFLGQGYLKMKLAALTGAGPITVRVTR